mmetsp:Transcript_9867/g.16598  ORF Transcript_9867/g.16598 Transcript_9867/m.16598 type:complete len:90 (-) Transcript_9867:845-1114(-)
MIFEDRTYSSNHFVTHQGAIFRKQHLDNVSYDVSLSLPKGQFYYGTVAVHFDLLKMPSQAKPVYLDFRGVQIGSFKINGVALENKEGDK